MRSPIVESTSITTHATESGAEGLQDGACEAMENH